MKRVHLNSLFGVVKDFGEDVFETQHVLDRRLASFRSLPDWLSLPSIVIVIGKFGRLHAHVIGNSVLFFFVVFFFKRNRQRGLFDLPTANRDSLNNCTRSKRPSLSEQKKKLILGPPVPLSIFDDTFICNYFFREPLLFFFEGLHWD